MRHTYLYVYIYIPYIYVYRRLLYLWVYRERSGENPEGKNREREPVGNRGGIRLLNARTGKRDRTYRALCAASAESGSRRKPIQRPPCLVARLFDSYHVRIKLPLFAWRFAYFYLLAIRFFSRMNRIAYASTATNPNHRALCAERAGSGCRAMTIQKPLGLVA